MSTAPIPTTWSFSRWSTWDKCPFAYKAKFILKLPDPPSPAMARGDRIHKALDAYLNGRGPLPSEVADPYQRRMCEEIAAMPRRLVEQKWGFTHGWRQTGFMSRDVWLRSICDVALPYDDDTVHVLDWKSGRRYGSNDEQVELFALATFQRFGKQASGGVRTTLVYLDSGQEEHADFKADDVPALKAKWDRRASEMLADRRFIPRAGCSCRWCEMKKHGEIRE